MPDKKKSKNNSQIAAGFSATQSAEISSREAAIKFAKSENYNRALFEDKIAMQNAKSKVFNNFGDKVRDPSTGKLLTQNQAQAKSLYGKNWTAHSPESDHVIPEKTVFETYKNDPFLTNENIKHSANIDENFQVISKRTNASKQDQSNSDFIKNPNRKAEISRKGEKNLLKKQYEAGAAVKSDASNQKIQNVISTGHNAGIQGAKYAGTTALTMSGVNNIIAVFKGEKNISDALFDTAKDGATGAASGYVMGGGLTLLSQQLSNSSSKIIQSLIKSNVPGKIITGLMAFGSSLKSFATGEINTQEFLIQMGDKGLNFASMSYGMAAGQTLIPIPVLGAAIGALVASALTSDLISNLMQKLNQKELEHQERLRIIAECEEAVKQEKIYRQELEYYLANYFREYRECFNDALSGMNLAVQNNDVDLFIVNSNKITSKLGGKVISNNLAGFRKFLSEPTIDEF